MKPPTIGGLFDAHGNLYEWTHDWYTARLGSEAAVIDPTGASRGSSRVLRGGSWSIDAANCRTAYRNSRVPTYRFSNFGFRLALSFPSVQSPEAAVKVEE